MARNHWFAYSANAFPFHEPPSNSGPESGGLPLPPFAAMTWRPQTHDRAGWSSRHALPGLASDAETADQRSIADHSLEESDRLAGRTKYSYSRSGWETILPWSTPRIAAVCRDRFDPQSVDPPKHSWCSDGAPTKTGEWNWHAMKSQSRPCCPRSTDRLCALQKAASTATYESRILVHR